MQTEMDVYMCTQLLLFQQKENMLRQDYEVKVV